MGAAKAKASLEAAKAKLALMEGKMAAPGTPPAAPQVKKATPSPQKKQNLTKYGNLQSQSKVKTARKIPVKIPVTAGLPPPTRVVKAMPKKGKVTHKPRAPVQKLKPAPAMTAPPKPVSVHPVGIPAEPPLHTPSAPLLKKPTKAVLPATQAPAL